MGYAALAEVLTGWTGTIAVTYSGTTTTITPYLRESVASLFARLIVQVREDSGFALLLTLAAPDQITISAAATFSMSLTGNCGTRTDYDTGPYSGAASYASDANVYTGAYVPTRGLRLDGITHGQDTGRATSTGASGYAGPLEMGSARLRMWSTFADTWANEDIQGVYDVWHDGRILGRGRIDSITRTRMGRLSDQVVMECDFAGCVE